MHDEGPADTPRNRGVAGFEGRALRASNYRIRRLMTSPPPPHALPRLHALIPCAGVGERAGTTLPKQYALVAGRSPLAHTVDAVARVGRIQSVLVVVAAGDSQHASHLAGTRAVAVPRGGATRADSVRNGLDALTERGARPHDWVLVHDAARCLVRTEWIDALIDACLDDPVGGLLALPLADTLKTERDGRAVATIDRAGKWQAQTPQMFRLGLLREALARVTEGVTDEAGAVEALGHAPKLVLGALENFKVTWPADLELAERLLRSRAEQIGLLAGKRIVMPPPTVPWGRPGRRSGETA